MADVTRLPPNFIHPHDRERLDSFMGHEIGRGRATRWHWSREPEVGDVLELYAGGADERLLCRITRPRERHAFQARDAQGALLVEGSLDHLMAALDAWLASLHGESQD